MLPQALPGCKPQAGGFQGQGGRCLKTQPSRQPTFLPGWRARLRAGAALWRPNAQALCPSRPVLPSSALSGRAHHRQQTCPHCWPLQRATHCCPLMAHGSPPGAASTAPYSPAGPGKRTSALCPTSGPSWGVGGRRSHLHSLCSGNGPVAENVRGWGHPVLVALRAPTRQQVGAQLSSTPVPPPGPQHTVVSAWPSLLGVCSPTCT